MDKPQVSATDHRTPSEYRRDLVALDPTVKRILEYNELAQGSHMSQEAARAAYIMKSSPEYISWALAKMLKGAANTDGFTAVGIGSPRTNGAISQISNYDTRCVVCQYVIERIKSDMLLNGLYGDYPTLPRVKDYATPDVQRELDSKTPPPPSFAPAPGASVVGGAPVAASAAAPVTAFVEVDATVRQAPEVRSGGVVGFLKSIPGRVSKRISNFRNSFSVNGNKPFAEDGKASSADPWAIPDPKPLPYVNHQAPPTKPFTNIFKSAHWNSHRQANTDLYVSRPTQVRYTHMSDLPLLTKVRARDRFKNNQMYETVYSVISTICQKHVPRAFHTYCAAMMEKYPKIVRGLQWKDRPDQICMLTEQCGEHSYIQRGPHAVYRPY